MKNKSHPVSLAEAKIFLDKHLPKLLHIHRKIDKIMKDRGQEIDGRLDLEDDQHWMEVCKLVWDGRKLWDKFTSHESILVQNKKLVELVKVISSIQFPRSILSNASIMRHAVKANMIERRKIMNAYRKIFGQELKGIEPPPVLTEKASAVLEVLDNLPTNRVLTGTRILSILYEEKKLISTKAASLSI